jgi:UDP-glucuronate decarboxylase
MFAYNSQNNVDVRVVRIFNTYGPRMLENDGRVISNFIVQALKGDDLTVYGDGKQTRSFCYIDDMVGGMIAMMAKDGLTGPVNLGNPEERTVLAMAEVIKGMTGSGSRIVHKGLPKDDPTQRQPDITIAKRELKWEPKTPLDQGLEKTIGYFRGLLNAKTQGLDDKDKVNIRAKVR